MVAVEWLQEGVVGRTRPRKSVLDWDLEGLKRELKRLIGSKEGVKAAYIFGSVAEGRPHAWSDIDLAVIQETQVEFLERPLEFQELFELGLPVDLFVYTPAEVRSMEATGHPFWKKVKQSGIQLL